MPRRDVFYADRDEPDVFAGHYRLTVEFERPQVDRPPVSDPDLPTPEAMAFTIEAPPRTIADGDVASRFPAPDTTGPLHGVIPHIALKDSRRPWTFGANPWLALVVVTQDDDVDFATDDDGRQRLRARNSTACRTLFGYRTLTGGQQFDAAADDITWSVERFTLGDDLARLAHVRRIDRRDATSDNATCSVILCTRAIRAGDIGRICLVDVSSITIDRGANTEFPCLLSWRFHASASKVPKFTQVFEAFTRRDPTGAAAVSVAPFVSPEPRIPKSASEAAWPALLAERQAHGHVVLPWQTRAGAESVAWYRGPLVPLGALPDPTEADAPGMPLHADALIRDDPATGLSDVGEAAAFEFGRLHALSNVTLRAALLRWRRRCARACHLEACHSDPARSLSHTHCGSDYRSPPFPVEAFVPLSTLKGVPPSYLVPEERMAPTESLRFVALDPVWVFRMLQGAYSLGADLFRCAPMHEAAPRLTGCDAAALDALRDLAGLRRGAHRREGFLLRSEALGLWPDLEVLARGTGRTAAAPLENMPRQIAPQMRLAIYGSALFDVTFRQPSETVHFEAPVAEADSGLWQRVSWFEARMKSSVVAARLRAPGRQAVFHLGS